MRKSRGKLGARGKQQAEENERNLEDQFAKAGDVENRVPGLQQEDWASAEVKVPAQAEVPGEKLRPDGRLWVEAGAVQNGPFGHSPAPAGGCVGHPGPDPRGDAEEAAVQPAAAEDN